MPQRFKQEFPSFYRSLKERDGAEMQHVLPPITDAEIKLLEAKVGVPLPMSYKRMLRCARGFWLLGGVVQLGKDHPFFHDFPPLEKLTLQQRAVVARKGGGWPPASQGMLCFGELFMEADGDQALWDVSHGLLDGEYPIYYYAHEARPPTVRKLSDRFDTWLGEFLQYKEFAN